MWEPHLRTGVVMPAERPSLSKAQIAAVSAGNALEFYDFLTYSFFAVQIGEALFPGSSSDTKLLFSLATFGVGFVTRPLGGFAIGRIADRRGRKPAMILTFTLMGIAIVGLALTPSYAMIGLAAPVLAVLFRMLQGFALGGEVGPNTAFLVEAAPPHRRAFYVSLQFATQNFSILIAGAVGLFLSSSLSPSALSEWGWRVALILGVLIVPFTIAIRRTLGETLVRAGGTQSAEPRKRMSFLAIAGILLLAGATIGPYTVNYITTFAQRALHIDARTAFGATVVMGVTMTSFNLVSGLLCDRYGRKPIATTAWASLFVVGIPAFFLMARYQNAAALFSMTALLAMIMGFLTPASVTLFTEALPARIRAGALGTVYAVSIAIFGGSAQFMEQLLVDITKSPIAPAFYMTGAIGIGVIGIFMLEETGMKGRRVEPPLLAAA
jgi:MFS family permease